MAAPPEARLGPAAGYISPPAVRRITFTAAGALVEGTAGPGSTVRLGAPDGEAHTARAAASGQWRIRLEPAVRPRIFGLSMSDKRKVQGEGYVLVLPKGPGVILRAGAGAEVLEPGASARILAVDFDSDGGAVVSGIVQPNSALSVRSQGRPVGEGRSDAAGRFYTALNQPLENGPQLIEVVCGDVTLRAQIEVGPAPGAGGSVMQVARVGGGLRIDWLTPGGGVQSTVLIG